MIILKLAWQETAGDKRNTLYYKKVLLLYMAHGECHAPFFCTLQRN